MKLGTESLDDSIIIRGRVVKSFYKTLKLKEKHLLRSNCLETLEAPDSHLSDKHKCMKTSRANQRETCKPKGKKREKSFPFVVFYQCLSHECS